MTVLLGESPMQFIAEVSNVIWNPVQEACELIM